MGSSPRHTARVLSFLKPEECAKIGTLPPFAIKGTFTDQECSIAGFRENPAFVEFMHEVIRTAGPDDPEMQEAAAMQENGWVYVIDLRTPDGPQGRVPIEDIIGGFEVTDGKLTADSYLPNEEHRVLTANGSVRLPPSLHEALARKAMERARMKP